MLGNLLVFGMSNWGLNTLRVVVPAFFHKLGFCYITSQEDIEGFYTSTSLEIIDLVIYFKQCSESSKAQLHRIHNISNTNPLDAPLLPSCTATGSLVGWSKSAIKQSQNHPKN